MTALAWLNSLDLSTLVSAAQTIVLAAVTVALAFASFRIVRRILSSMTSRGD